MKTTCDECGDQVTQEQIDEAGEIRDTLHSLCPDCARSLNEADDKEMADRQADDKATLTPLAFPAGGEWGMNIRDYFAAKALEGFMAAGRCDDPSAIAADSYRIADAMLAERG